jgi:hypothetical protein
MRFPGFIGPSYTLQSPNVDCQRCVNLFPEINALGTGKEREVAALVPTQGKRLKLTLPNSPVRDIFTTSTGGVYAVGGNKLYSISSSWVATELGTLNTSTGAVSMADNGTYLVLVDGVNGYTWNMSTNTFATITDPNFYPADRVEYLDGYFIFNKTGTGQFFISALNGVTFDALDIATAEGSPDVLVGHIVANQQLYLFGAQSTEVFYDSGAVDFPFARIQGAVNDVGCYAAHSIRKILNRIYFLGGDDTGFGVVYRMNGYQSERISTPAIESQIRTLDADTLADSRAWVYQQGGHAFYCLNLPGSDTTWVYDVTTSMWHERVYSGLWGLERDRADCHAVAYGMNIVGDYDNGKIYALDPDYYSDDGNAIPKIRAAPHMSQSLKVVRHNSFQLDMEVGTGLTSGQGLNPQAILQWSDDGGHTWSDERWASIGKIGETKVRVVWRRLGSSRDRVYRVIVSDPVKTVLIGAEVDVEGGVS